VEFSSCLFLNYRSVLRMKCAFDFCEFSYWLWGSEWCI
jgi:hypothetical protein